MRNKLSEAPHTGYIGNGKQAGSIEVCPAGRAVIDLVV